jgi:hypothetical protein
MPYSGRLLLWFIEAPRRSGSVGPLRRPQSLTLTLTLTHTPGRGFFRQLL